MSWSSTFPRFSKSTTFDTTVSAPITQPDGNTSTQRTENRVPPFNATCELLLIDGRPRVERLGYLTNQVGQAYTCPAWLVKFSSTEVHANAKVALSSSGTRANTDVT